MAVFRRGEGRWGVKVLAWSVVALLLINGLRVWGEVLLRHVTHKHSEICLARDHVH